MSENNNQSSEQPYIVEKIVQSKSGSRRYLLNLLLGIFAAIVFGVIACFTFVMVYPYMNARIHPNEPLPEETITLPKYTEASEGTSAENEEHTTMEAAETSTEISETAENDVGLDNTAKEWIRDQLNKLNQELTPKLKDLASYSKEMNTLYSQVEKSLVGITSAQNTSGLFSQNIDFESGIIIATMAEKRRVYILSNFDVLSLTDLRVKFTGVDGYYEAELAGYDSILDLSVITVSFEEEEEKIFQSLSPIEMGNTYLVRQGSVVMAVGSPFSYFGTMGYGSIVSIEKELSAYDTQYRMFYTNINAPHTGQGFLVNLDGQLVGVLNSKYRRQKMSEYVSAIGTDEISDYINHMANGVTYSYCGVIGQTITASMAQSGGIPQGIYVTDVYNGSPAYEAGIMNGDVITAISTVAVTKYSQFTDALLNRHLPGESVIITVMRQGKNEYKQIEITVKLGVRR